jgi:hypothetical protein
MKRKTKTKAEKNNTKGRIRTNAKCACSTRYLTQGDAALSRAPSGFTFEVEFS